MTEHHFSLLLGPTSPRRWRIDLDVIFVTVVELVAVIHSICNHIEVDLVPQHTADTTETFYELIALLRSVCCNIEELGYIRGTSLG